MSQDQKGQSLVIIMMLAAHLASSPSVASQDRGAKDLVFGQLCGEWGDDGRLPGSVAGGVSSYIRRLEQFASEHPESRFADDATYLVQELSLVLNESDAQRADRLEAWVSRYPDAQIDDPGAPCFRALQSTLTPSPAFWVRVELVLLTWQTRHFERASRHSVAILDAYGGQFLSSADERFKRTLRSMAVMALAALQEQGEYDAASAVEVRVAPWFDSLEALQNTVNNARKRLSTSAS